MKKYYALFLSGESHIEKCIVLLKHVSNPRSKSLPHITLRLFDEQDDKLEYIKKIKLSFLNIIEVGTFNFDTANGPYIVYLKCESEELEAIDYRPDFPFSRLHITIYEGKNLNFAKKLTELLKSISWPYKLVFKSPRLLTEQILGGVNHRNFDFTKAYKEVLEDSFDEVSEDISDEKKMQRIKGILESMHDYMFSKERQTGNISSLYLSQDEVLNPKKYVDESARQDSTGMEGQLVLEGGGENCVNKPVQDAIYVTPPEYARDMAICAINALGDSSKPIAFGDSSIGTGALFIALLRAIDVINKKDNMKFLVSSAIGVDIDERMAKEAYLRCSKRGLKVIYGDAISEGIKLDQKRNLMMVNPPYNRHEDIPKEYRELAKELAQRQTGIQVSAEAGLFVYHLLIMDKWLEKEGVAVWLLPTIFLQTNYGKALRNYLIENVQLLRLHVYDEEKVQFYNTMISTTIVVFKKVLPNDMSSVMISYGHSIEEPRILKKIEIGQFQKNIDNWRTLVFGACDYIMKKEIASEGITFASLFEIKRGLATGANSFFVMRRGQARGYGIPDIALKPILPKARQLKSQIINRREDGYPDLEPQMVLIDCELDEEMIKEKYPTFYYYLQKAKEKAKDGKAIVDRTLVRARKPWYKQEQRTPPLYLLTYMGRNKKDIPPLYFLLNKSNAVALNTYLLLYPKPWLVDLLYNSETLCEQLLTTLNSMAERVISNQTRVYSGGLQKLEPNALKKTPIFDLPNVIIEAYQKLND